MVYIVSFHLLVSLSGQPRKTEGADEIPENAWLDGEPRDRREPRGRGRCPRGRGRRSRVGGASQQAMSKRWPLQRGGGQPGEGGKFCVTQHPRGFPAETWVVSQSADRNQVSGCMGMCYMCCTVTNHLFIMYKNDWEFLYLHKTSQFLRNDQNFFMRLPFKNGFN